MLSMSLTLILIFGLLFGLLARIGYYFGLSGWFIIFLAGIIIFLQWYFSPSLIWLTTNMRLLKKNELPWLRSMVEDICKAKKVPTPKIAIVYSGLPNAFVFGRTPGSAVLGITQGLINRLEKEEIKS